MNPVFSGVLLAWVLAATFAPWRRPGRARPFPALALEAGSLAAVFLAARWLAGALPAAPAVRDWGVVLLYLAGYWYVCAGGVVVVRLVLGFVPVNERAGAQAGAVTVSPIEMGRGRIIGVLERAVALTLVLLGQFGALGLIIAAKALARFKALEDRDFAEYFLIGTLASLLHALLVGTALRALV